MKNLLITTAVAALMSTSAFATNISTDFFKANGYTKPSESIEQIQAKIDSGQYYNYPYVAGRSTTGLFDKKLKPGTAIPQIKNVTKLLAALDKKQVILVADASGSVAGCLPVFAEIAKQNGTTCGNLMDHFTANEMPSDNGDSFFSNIDSVMDTVTEKANEMIAEIQKESNNEIIAEVTADITNDIMDDVKEELNAIEQLLQDRFNAAFGELANDPQLQMDLQGVVDGEFNTVREALEQTIAEPTRAQVNAAQSVVSYARSQQ